MSRQGYHLNQFCMSLMKAENRARFKANERAYLDEWPMSEEQKQAVLARDLNRCIALGGNIYFLAKIGATDGKSFQQMAGSMTGMTEERISRHDGQAAAAPSKATATSGRRSNGPYHRERLHLARAGDRRGARPRQDRTSPIGSRCSRATNSPSSG